MIMTTRRSLFVSVALTMIAATMIPVAAAFTVGHASSYDTRYGSTVTGLAAESPTPVSEGETVSDRRSVLQSGAALLASQLLLAGGAQPASAETTDITPFNGLIFNYRGGSFVGLDASTLNEPSVPFLEFGQRLKQGEVAFVEFLAPDGDVAYVTFKTSGDEQTPSKPIRIGQGYPVEQHDGWSSPAFVVRALQNYNVPYKFTIPALAKFRES